MDLQMISDWTCIDDDDDLYDKMMQSGANKDINVV